MVGIVIENDFIGIPKPIVDKIIVVRSHREKAAAESETLSIASAQPKEVTRPSAAGKTAVFPGTIDTIMRVIAAGLVSDPLIILVNVGSIRMARLV